MAQALDVTPDGEAVIAVGYFTVHAFFSNAFNVATAAAAENNSNSTLLLSEDTSVDMFVARYRVSDGALEWVFAGGGDESEAAWGVAVSAVSQLAVVTGYSGSKYPRFVFGGAFVDEDGEAGNSSSSSDATVPYLVNFQDDDGDNANTLDAIIVAIDAASTVGEAGLCTFPQSPSPTNTPTTTTASPTTAGRTRWQAIAGGSGDDASFDAVISPDESRVVVVGYFESNATFGFNTTGDSTGGTVIYGNGALDAFVAVLNMTGE